MTTPTWLSNMTYIYIAIAIFATVVLYYTFKQRSGKYGYMFNIRTLFGSNIDGIANEGEESMATSKNYTYIEEQLKKAIYIDKVYLNPQLTLSDLATFIGTNRTYLSRYINNYKSTSFVNYINDFRLEEAQQVLKNNVDGLSISEVSERCGFASYSTFRRVYKQRYGYSPSEETTEEI